MERNYDFLKKLERGVYFEKKEYTSAPLISYDEAKPKLPTPIFEARPDWVSCFDYAIKVLFTNTHAPAEGSGFVSNFVDAAFNKDIFLWDTVFMTLFCNLLHPYVPGICSLDNFYCKQFEDGEIPREMVRDTGEDLLLWVNAFDKPLYSYFHNNYGYRRLWHLQHLTYEDMYKPEMGRVIEKNPYLTLDNLNHPLLAMAEWYSYCHTQDINRLKMVLEPLVQYYRALKYHLRHENGLYVTDWASMDNSPRNKYLGFGVDISSEMVLFARNLLDIMEALKANGFEEFENKALKDELSSDISSLSEKINSLMWNEAEGFYYDVTFEGKQTGIKTAAAFWPLIAGVADQNQANRLAQWLCDKDTFNRAHRVPTLSAAEPDFNPNGGYWRGAVWAPINAMVVLGLEKRGFHQLAREIAINHVDCIAQVFKQTGTIWENYPADSISSGDSDNKDFVGWTGMGPILFFVQYGVGLSYNPSTDTVEWRLDKEAVSQGAVGCKNYWFAGKTANFTAITISEGVRLEAEADKPFKLSVYYNGKNYAVTVAGIKTIILD